MMTMVGKRRTIGAREFSVPPWEQSFRFGDNARPADTSR